MDEHDGIKLILQPGVREEEKGKYLSTLRQVKVAMLLKTGYECSKLNDQNTNKINIQEKIRRLKKIKK